MKSFNEFIGESRDGDLQAFKNIQASALSPSDFTRIFNKKLGDNWIEVSLWTPLYTKAMDYYKAEYPNKSEDIFKIGDDYFVEISSDQFNFSNQTETLAIVSYPDNAMWIPFRQMMKIDSTFLMDNLFGEF